ncbi:MAG: hypothetical protein R3E84_19000 [Pseudomonadales bacterium]
MTAAHLPWICHSVGPAFTPAEISITFSAAASAGKNLNTEHRMTDTGGNVVLQAATLSAARAKPAPVLQSPGNQNATVGAALTVNVSASDTDGPSPLALSVSASSTTGKRRVYRSGGTVFPTNLNRGSNGSAAVTFRAREANNGAFDEKTITINVSPAGQSGDLSVSAPQGRPLPTTSPPVGSLD